MPGWKTTLKAPSLLLLEHVVGLRCFGERQVVAGERVDAEDVTVRQQRQQVVDPALHVGLTHPQLDLLVEHHHHRQRVAHAAVHADHRDRPAAPDDVDGQL